MPVTTERLTAFVSGHVQGVGFRWWARSRGLELGLVGYARNLEDGRVEIVAQGPTEALDALVELLRAQPSTHRRPRRPARDVCAWGEPRDGAGALQER